MATFSDQRGLKRKSNALSEKPREINIVEYAQSRASEIEALAADLTSKTGNKLIFQLIPRSLRRRAMSHNIKRLPRRLHSLAKPEYEKRMNTSKRPSRKHRRRPKNLMAEYNRRQRKHVWLETHIWHAKRFKMEDRWGYRIPVHSTDKSIKASYRATRNHCQIQDISYMCCIEIVGEEDKILDGLSHLTSPKTGLTFGAKSYLSGTREGNTCVYRYDTYPNHGIGCISFLWRPLTNEDDSLESSKRQLWVWCHPSCYTELLDQLKICFKFSGDEMDSMLSVSEKGDSQTFSTGEITIRSLKDLLNRHRLTGPSSNQILFEVLQPANILKKESDSHWWQKYYQKTSLSLAFTHQGEFIESLKKTSSPGEYAPHSVIGVTVGDPRIGRPEKRCSVTQSTEDIETDMCSDQLVPDVSMSALWYSAIREEVKATKMSDQKLNELKSDIFIPGSLPDLGIEESRIPVILIQRPGVRQSSSINYGCGWDVVLPQNWSMSFWLACIYRGARAAGVRELESLALEQKIAYFPNDYPDTAAGRLHEQDWADKLKNKFEKRPPAKRCNYTKLGIASPFCYPWDELIRDWNEEISDVNNKNIYMLRDRKALKIMQKLINARTTITHKESTNSKSCIKKGDTNHELSSMFSEHRFSLIHVEVKMLLRGIPEEHATICIPAEEDLDMLQKDKTYSGPLEPVHTDSESLKTKKKKASSTQTTTHVSKGIRHFCSRAVIGLVNHGGFLFVEGQGGGLGLCSLAGLQHLLQQTPGLVLIRNPSSYQYRFAYLSVLDFIPNL